jgi:hypothetical protein
MKEYQCSEMLISMFSTRLGTTRGTAFKRNDPAINANDNTALPAAAVTT